MPKSAKTRESEMKWYDKPTKLQIYDDFLTLKRLPLTLKN